MLQVCGQKGHKAGFVGATYLDCPNKPCYLCKQRGHTTATCPYRVAPGHGCTAAKGADGTGSAVQMIMQREQVGFCRVQQGSLGICYAHCTFSYAVVMRTRHQMEFEGSHCPAGS